jgi:pimeloyl-ACP methyl ester carboxylesterase
MAFAAALLAAGLLPAATTLAASSTCGGSGTVTTQTGTLADGAMYKIECPGGPWNGTLFLYSHGYVVPGDANPAQDAGDRVTAAWLLDHGYALAGSSYATTGWAIQQALPDQIGTLDAFDQAFRTPTRTVAWGHSLGGIITAGLIQRYPGRFSAALPMCGVLSGGVATWNTALERRVRLPAADRPLGPDRQHHEPHRQPDRRHRGRDRGTADAAGPGPAGADGRARRHPGLVHSAVIRATAH